MADATVSDTVSGTGTTDYRSYAEGARAEKIASGNLTSQFYSMGGLGYLDAGDTEFAANQEIAEYDGATLLRRYVRLPGSVDEAVLMIDQSLPAGDRERWAHPNRLGSTIVISDSVGAVVDTHTHSPFGQAGEGDGGFPFRFTGQKLDPETGLYYYKARYYDPELGQFLQTDPIGYADQMNLYAYVANDPVNATDPTGEWRVFAKAAYGAYFGGVSGYTASQISGDGSLGSNIAGAVSGALAGAISSIPGNAPNPAIPAAAGSAAGLLGDQAYENYATRTPIDSNLNVDLGAVLGAATGSKLAAPVVGRLQTVGVQFGGRKGPDGFVNRGFASRTHAPGILAAAVVDGLGTGTGEVIGAALGQYLEENYDIPATFRITDTKGNEAIGLVKSCSEGLSEC